MRNRWILILVAAIRGWAQLPVPIPVVGADPNAPSENTPAVSTPLARFTFYFAEAPDGTIAYSEPSRIRSIDPQGNVHTLLADSSGLSRRVAYDPAGNLYYFDSALPPGILVLKNGVPFRVAGGGKTPAADGVPAADAMFYASTFAFHPSGTLYFADSLLRRVFRIDATGILRAVAGIDTPGSAGEGGPAVSAQLNFPTGLTFDPAGNLYLTDSGNDGVRLLRIDASGTLTRLSTQPAIGNLTAGPDGSLYFFTNQYPSQLTRRTPDGALSPMMVSGGFGFQGCGPGPFTPQPFNLTATQITADKNGLLLLASPGPLLQQRLLRLDFAGNLQLVGGGPESLNGDGGPASNVVLAQPQAVAVDAVGNLFIADSGNHRIRKVTKDGVIQTFAGFGPTADTIYCSPPPGPFLNSISGLSWDSSGDLYASDSGANRVWKIDSAGQVSEFVKWPFPSSVAVDAAHNVWVSSGSKPLTKFAPDGTVLNFLPAIQPKSLGSDPAGNVYVATQERIYRVGAGDQLIPLASPFGPAGTFEGPGANPGDSYPVGISPYAGGSNAAFADSAGTLYNLTTAGLQIVPSSCATRIIPSSPQGPNFSLGAADPVGGGYLLDPGSSRIFHLDAEPPSFGAIPVPALEPASVRNLASGIVWKKLISFQYGDFGGVGLGSFSFVSDAVAPGELIRISGTCLGPFDAVEDHTTIPTSLAGVQVTFDGVPAPLFHVSSAEVVAEVPYEIAGQSQTQMTVTSNGGPVSATIPVAATAPGLFNTADSTGTLTVTALNSDGAPNSAKNPAQVGSVIGIYATGLGQTNPPSVDGAVRSNDRQVTAKVSVQIGAAPAEVVYAGPAPGYVGLEQINIRVPAAKSGIVNIQVGGVVRSQPVMLWIAN